jgi:hypothetical protein
MTQGLTINQRAADDAIIALKSNDVAHGITVLSEIDTYTVVSRILGSPPGAIAALGSGLRDFFEVLQGDQEL